MPRRIGVIGIGPLGFAVLAAALADSTPEVAAADGYKPRRLWPEKLGVSSATPQLAGEFDAIVDTVGTANTRAESVSLLRPGGAALWMGLHGPEDDVDAQAMIRSEKRAISSFCYSSADFAQATHIVTGLDMAWAEAVPLRGGVEAHRLVVGGCDHRHLHRRGTDPRRGHRPRGAATM